MLKEELMQKIREEVLLHRDKIYQYNEDEVRKRWQYEESVSFLKICLKYNNDLFFLLFGFDAPTRCTPPKKPALPSFFIEQIKRPYFHVKSLDRIQLRAWHSYLDWEIAQLNQDTKNSSQGEYIKNSISFVAV